MLRGRLSPEPDRGDDERDEPSRWTKSGTACAIALVAMLVISGAIIAWSRLSGHDASRAAQSPPSVPATGSVPAPAAAAGTGRGEAPASSAPTEVTWLQVGLGALPFSGSAGPARIRAGVPSGFTHTQPGAVQAAIQILGRMSWSAQTRTSMRAVAVESTTPAAQALAALTYDAPSDPSVIPAVAGFQMVTYSAGQAVVNIALRFNGTLRVVPATMQWDTAASRGDWKLAGAPGPLSQTNWAAVDDLTGYILFSGQPTKAGD